MTKSRDSVNSRSELNDDEFFKVFYENSGFEKDLVIELLGLVASEIRVPSGKLRPTDRFNVELSPGRWNDFDSGFAMLMHELDAMAKKRGMRIEQPISTVDEYIRAMASLYPA